MSNVYFVSIPEVHYCVTRVEADSYVEALQRVKNGPGGESTMELEYSHTLDFELWKVCKEGDMYEIEFAEAERLANG